MIPPFLLAAGLALSNPEFLALSLECLIRILISFHKRRPVADPAPVRPPPRKARPPPRRKGTLKRRGK